MHAIARRSFLKEFALIGSALLLSQGCSRRVGNALLIGYQKWGTFSILKASGMLDQAFRERGLNVKWIEFPAGPPLLEALNAGSIDLGHTGDSPPIFAQAAGVPFHYFAVSSPSPESSALLVHRTSNIHSGADLKGKRIGYTKGTSAHTMVLRYLEKIGLKLDDVQSTYLPPAEGRIAVESGSIDAWSIWDPYLAGAEQAGNVRTLVSGTGIVDGREYYLCSHRFAQHSRELLNVFRQELVSVKKWAQAHIEDVNNFLCKESGLPPDVVALAESRRNRYDTLPLGSEVIAGQQDLADRYWQLGLIPKQIDIKQALLEPSLNGS